MEVLTTDRIPQSSPFLAVVALMRRSSSTSIGVWLVAEGAIIAEFTWAVLPADWSDTIVVVATPRVAQKAVLLLVGRAGRDRNADTTAVCLHPASLDIVIGDLWLKLGEQLLA